MSEVIKENTYLRCIRCVANSNRVFYLFKRPYCGSLLSVEYDLSRINIYGWDNFKGEGI